MGRRSSVVVVFAFAGCAPRVTDFHVEPQAYCSTTGSIQIRWVTEHGEPTLQVSPPDATPQYMGDRTEATIKLPRWHHGTKPPDITVTVSAVKGSRHDTNSAIVAGGDSHELAGDAGDCANGWMTTKPQAMGTTVQFAPGAHPMVISNRCGTEAKIHDTCKRAMKVMHAGKTWEIPADDARNVAGDNVDMGGDWILAGKLLDGEECGSAPDAQTFSMGLEFGCKETR